MKDKSLDQATVLVLGAYLESFLALCSSLKAIEGETKTRAEADRRVFVQAAMPWPIPQIMEPGRSRHGLPEFNRARMGG